MAEAIDQSPPPDLLDRSDLSSPQNTPHIKIESVDMEIQDDPQATDPVKESKKRKVEDAPTSSSSDPKQEKLKHLLIFFSDKVERRQGLKVENMKLNTTMCPSQSKMSSTSLSTV
ncbi:hypothetical protein N7495_005934 [Penicillium taxi]|uniref:uncharacterized protein n=1 Tax=Penicillium taxi TaxID=168475 RepID=UPI002544E1EF|nr:uncharacterized protein N7495_005934 [Penicillium taxi]KAJ5894243.1 hypothetical protein N7495_005934 [Penicillium taxi]